MIVDFYFAFFCCIMVGWFGSSFAILPLWSPEFFICGGFSGTFPKVVRSWEAE